MKKEIRFRIEVIYDLIAVYNAILARVGMIYSDFPGTILIVEGTGEAQYL